MSSYCSLSPGQKQLIVLARALLQNHKILIMDEATASIDSETDADISKVVHESFSGCTVLIIAHRLRVSLSCTTGCEIKELSHQDNHALLQDTCA